MRMSNKFYGFSYVPVIFPGHGGLINEEYITSPDKMHEFEDGFTVYEGVINRLICDYIVKYLQDFDIPYVYLNTPVDTKLSHKTKITDLYNEQTGNCFLLDIHNNAGGGTGSEVYTSPGQTESDPIATSIYNEINKSMGKGWEMRDGRGDGDPDKEAKFYVLMNTKLPSVLVECGFMDTRRDAEVITSEKGQDKLALGIANGILKINGCK